MAAKYAHVSELDIQRGCNSRFTCRSPPATHIVQTCWHLVYHLRLHREGSDDMTADQAAEQRRETDEHENRAATTTFAEQIESAYQRIGITSAHLGIVAMVLFGVFFDAI